MMKALALVIIPTLTMANAIKSQYQLTCKVELLGNSGTPKIISSQEISDDLTDLSVDVQFGSNILKGEVILSGKDRFTMKPTLNMNVLESITKDRFVYQMSASGFETKFPKNPFTLSGYQFRKIKHEKVNYTRVDYQCQVIDLKK